MSKPKRKVVGYDALGMPLVMASETSPPRRLSRLLSFRRRAWFYLNQQERRNLDELIVSERTVCTGLAALSVLQNTT